MDIFFVLTLQLLPIGLLLTIIIAISQFMFKKVNFILIITILMIIGILFLKHFFYIYIILFLSIFSLIGALIVKLIFLFNKVVEKNIRNDK